MKAITFAAPIPNYLATLVGGRISDKLLVGKYACTRYADVEEPALPGQRWVRIRTLLGGICGSDLNVITLKASPSTSPFSSFPFVLGHENVGEVIEVGSEVRGVARGDRVTANPLLCCEPRGITPVCAACATGQHQRCGHFTDGELAPGLLIGTTRSLGGSWGEQFVAHESQVVRVPETMSNKEAVLVEPLACSVHAVRANMPSSGQRVLVIGAGSIGLLTVAALKALVPDVHVTVLARHDFQGYLAKKLGADGIVGAHGDYLEALAEAGQVRLLAPVIGKRVGVGGFDSTFICIGGTRATDDALRVTRAGGTAVLLGNSGKMSGIDWTPLWLKEITLRGSLCYGEHTHTGPRMNAFNEAAELIAWRKAPIGPILTHTFALDEHRAALAAAMDKGQTKSVKVAFEFD